VEIKKRRETFDVIVAMLNDTEAQDWRSLRTKVATEEMRKPMSCSLAQSLGWSDSVWALHLVGSPRHEGYAI